MGACVVISDATRGDIKRTLEMRVKYIHPNPMTEAIIAEYNAVIANVDSLNTCPPGNGGKSKRSGGGRKPSKRNVWIGHCMRKPDNGGLGKDMKSCSDEWKVKGEDLLEKYHLTAPEP